MPKAKKRGTKGYGWDRAVGLLGILVDALVLGLGTYAARLAIADPKLMRMHQPVVIGVGAFVLAVVLVNLAINIGIFASRRWAFILAALFAGYGMSSGSYASSGFMLLYTVLRLGQVFGPPLK